MKSMMVAMLLVVAGSSAALAQQDPPPPPPPPPPPGSNGPGGAPQVQTVETAGSVQIMAEVWADNWFALYVNGAHIATDSVPITTERSFNAERIVFRADYPLTLAFQVMDYRENDTGLEYIGTNRQQMGDGGFIAQFTDMATGRAIAVTDSNWRCLVTHEAPLDTSCVRQLNPAPGVGACTFSVTPEPPGWQQAGFYDSAWPHAREYSAGQVRPKDGYDHIDWAPQAALIWGPNLETDNTLLCRLQIGG